MVEFVKEWNGGYLYLIGRNSDTSGLHTEWYDGEGNYHNETISPILALEFEFESVLLSNLRFISLNSSLIYVINILNLVNYMNMLKV